MITYLDRTFKEEQNCVHFKMMLFSELVQILVLFTKSVVPKRLTKMLTGIIHKLMH